MAWLRPREQSGSYYSEWPPKHARTHTRTHRTGWVWLHYADHKLGPASLIRKEEGGREKASHFSREEDDDG
ncbi:hypothetical protein BHE74_00001908 [Ensete ventricosum]|nr:hypothetical protein BHE74_00001908 [Ensete ventricosum]